MKRVFYSLLVVLFIISVGIVFGIRTVDAHDGPPTGHGHTESGEICGTDWWNPCPADAFPTLTSEERARIASLVTFDTVIFNELLNASNDAHDWIELRNITDVDVDLSGWSLIIISSEGGKAIAFPAGTVLPAGDLLLFANTDPSEPNMPLAISEDASYNYLVVVSVELNSRVAVQRSFPLLTTVLVSVLLPTNSDTLSACFTISVSQISCLVAADILRNSRYVLLKR